ncbi:MAG TPA: dihydrofolate reductase family protein [Roseiflexaceae bacterium]|nr:dihydrofolate reductase family protein [Roseiflexaceae bacterium]
MRELIYYVATTLDGFICHQDGSIDGFPWDETYMADLLATFPETFPPHLRSAENRQLPNTRFDTVLMGRNTYEPALKAGITSPYPTLRQYVFSRSLADIPDPGVTLVANEPVEAVRKLKGEEGQAIWLCGGAQLAGTLFAADLIDRVIVKVNPVLFGSGIPLFTGVTRQAALAPVDHKSYASGHMVLHYRVIHPAS